VNSKTFPTKALLFKTKAARLAGAALRVVWCVLLHPHDQGLNLRIMNHRIGFRESLLTGELLLKRHLGETFAAHDLAYLCGRVFGYSWLQTFLALW
jgi:hypothetical protein